MKRHLRMMIVVTDIGEIKMATGVDPADTRATDISQHSFPRYARQDLQVEREGQGTGN